MKGLRFFALALVSTLLACGKDAPETPAPPSTPTAPAPAAAPAAPAAEEVAAPAEPASPPSEVEETLAEAQEFIDKVDEGLKRAQALKAAIEAAIEQNRGIPPSLDSVRARSIPPTGGNVESIDVADNGSIIVEFAAERGFPGGTVEMKPVVNNGTVSSWECEGGTLPANYRPSGCG